MSSAHFQIVLLSLQDLHIVDNALNFIKDDERKFMFNNFYSCLKQHALSLFSFYIDVNASDVFIQCCMMMSL